MTREEMLTQCIETVTKHRQDQYGKPEDNFADIAVMWGQYLGKELTSVDVTFMMILLKVVRGKNNSRHIDNFLDIAGYAACGCEIATKDDEDVNS